MLSPSKIPVITIDGPTSSGKGTFAKLIAQHYNYHLLDSGAIYRALAVVVLDNAIVDKNTIIRTAKNLAFQITVSNQDTIFHLEKTNITKRIREEPVGMKASELAAIPQVRKALFEKQRAFKALPGLVADGRDMGTIIFPEASVKFFLTASLEIRAERRFNQLNATGISATYDHILKELSARDEKDKTRSTAPLAPAVDAHHLDTSKLNIKDTLACMIQIINQSQI